MKKTLIALAAVAATGAAFAQSTVSLTGKFGVAFQQAPGATAGVAVTDGDVVFSAVEDLGGGMKAAASMAVRVRGRGAAGVVDGRDATVSLMGGFGTVTLGAVEAGNGIVGRGFAGAPVSLANGYDDNVVLAGATNVDLFQYTSPALIPGLNAVFQRVDSVGGPGGGKGALQANVFGVNYAAGPISAGLDITDFSGATANRTRASASYDLGVARVGVGYQKSKGSDAQTAFGVSVPMGAITAGLVYAKNGDNSAYGVGANYALSKRTVINVSFGAIDAGGADGSATNDSQYRVRVMHSF